MAGSHYIFETSEAQLIVPGWVDNVDNPDRDNEFSYINSVCLPFSAAHSKLKTQDKISSKLIASLQTNLAFECSVWEKDEKLPNWISFAHCNNVLYFIWRCPAKFSLVR
jgi:hypothetical protein